MNGFITFLLENSSPTLPVYVYVKLTKKLPECIDITAWLYAELSLMEIHPAHQDCVYSVSSPMADGWISYIVFLFHNKKW